jgi:hypothetical protein
MNARKTTVEAICNDLESISLPVEVDIVEAHYYTVGVHDEPSRVDLRYQAILHGFELIPDGIKLRLQKPGRDIETKKFFNDLVISTSHVVYFQVKVWADPDTEDTKFHEESKRQVEYQSLLDPKPDEYTRPENVSLEEETKTQKSLELMRKSVMPDKNHLVFV